MNIPAVSGPSSLSGVVDVTTSDTTSSDTSNCLNLYKPYRIVVPPGSDSLVRRELLEDFADFLDLQVDEVYARVRDAVCDKLANDVEIGCGFSADTIYPCSPASHTICGDPTDTGNAVIVMNTAVLELSYTGLEGGCDLDSMYTTETALRFRGHNGDSVDICYSGIGGVSAPGPMYKIYYLPREVINGTYLWVNNSEYGAVSGSTPSNGLDNDRSVSDASLAPYPLTGLMQTGILTVNTNMDRDTVFFATTFTNTHGGIDTTGGPVGTGTGSRQRGFRYRSATAYTITLDWGTGSSGFVGDSLWIQSTTDSSFVIGIKYSATTRTVHWQTFGSWKTRNP